MLLECIFWTQTMNFQSGVPRSDHRFSWRVRVHCRQEFIVCNFMKRAILGVGTLFVHEKWKLF